MHLKNILIGFAIVVLTAFVVGYGIETFYPSPEWNDYCQERNSPKLVQDQANCVAEGGTWQTYEHPVECVTAPCPQGYCDLFSECQESYQNANEKYSKNLFIITLVLGIILIAVGGALFELEAVGAGIMGGGIATIFYGSVRYWDFAGDALRFILSLVGLIAVIYLAYWLNNRSKKRKKKFKFWGK